MQKPMHGPQSRAFPLFVCLIWFALPTLLKIATKHGDVCTKLWQPSALGAMATCNHSTNGGLPGHGCTLAADCGFKNGPATARSNQP